MGRKGKEFGILSSPGRALDMVYGEESLPDRERVGVFDHAFEARLDAGRDARAEDAGEDPGLEGGAVRDQAGEDGGPELETGRGGFGGRGEGEGKGRADPEHAFACRADEGGGVVGEEHLAAGHAVAD